MPDDDPITTLRRLAAEWRAVRDAATRGPWATDQWGDLRDSDGRRIPIGSTPSSSFFAVQQAAANTAFVIDSANADWTAAALAACAEAEQLRREVEERADLPADLFAAEAEAERLRALLDRALGLCRECWGTGAEPSLSGQWVADPCPACGPIRAERDAGRAGTISEEQHDA